MRWSESEEDGVSVLKLHGEIDLHESPELRQVLAAKTAARCPRLLIDLSGVSYLDSSGLATLVEYRREAQRFSGRLALAGLNEQVRTIFDLVRLSEIFTIFPAVAEARVALAA